MWCTLEFSLIFKRRDRSDMNALISSLAARLNSRAGRGTLWTVSVFLGSQILRVVSTLTLTRLLFPEAFGLMALVSVFLVGLEMITDAGIYQAVVKHERAAEQRFLDTAWTLQVLRGVSLFACACTLAFPIGQIYQQPELVWLLPAAATTTLLQGFGSLSVPLANRRMEFARPAILELTSATLSLAATIVAAWILESVWAIVIGGFVGATLRLVGSYTFVPGPRFRLSIDKTIASDILQFGKWIFASSLITFVAMQSDKLLFGHLIPIALLGSYSIAEQFSRLMRQVAEEVSGRVVFPVMAATHREAPERVRPMLAAAEYWQSLLVFGAGALGGIGTALIGFLYDERYAAAGWMLEILCVKTAISVSTRAGSNCLVATGRPYYGASEQLATAVLLVAGVFWAFPRFGVEGVVWAVALAEIGSYIVINYGLIRCGYFSLGAALLPFVAFLAGIASGRYVTSLPW